MGRKAQPAAELVQDAPLNNEALALVQNATALASDIGEERDLVNQLLGQAQMAGAFEDFSRTVRASKLAFVKENKLYKALKGKKSTNGSCLLGTWEEFCELLGISHDKANMDIANLQAFGEEALESMSRMGIGYRELRQWRRLPDDSRSALIEAVKQGNKEAVEYLAEELIATHAKEKSALEKQVDDLQADKEALGQRIAHKSRELEETTHELAKTRRRIQSMKADEAEKALRKEVAAAHFEAETALKGTLYKAFSILSEHSEQTGSDHRPFQANLVRQLEMLLLRIREEFQLPEGEAAGDIGEFGWIEQMGNGQQAESVEG